jgi:hypothetical protein
MDDIGTLFTFLFFGMLLGVITGAIAQKKGGSFLGWWLFGTLLFIIALPMALLMETNTRELARKGQGTKGCPYCGTTMPVKERTCPKCNRLQPTSNISTGSSWEKTVAGADEVEKWAKQNEPKDSN